MQDFRVQLNSNLSSFSEEAIRARVRYSWPGNIRELINAVERSVLLCEGDQVTLHDLPRTIVPGPRHAHDARPSTALNVLLADDWQSRHWKDVRNAIVGSCEQTYFVHQLGMTRGNVDETARRAGINPRSLYDLMKRHGLKKENFRRAGE